MWKASTKMKSFWRLLGGIMVIKGHDLHIKQLNLNEGNVEIEGYVDSIEYMEDNLKKGRGLFARLLK